MLGEYANKRAFSCAVCSGDHCQARMEINVNIGKLPPIFDSELSKFGHRCIFPEFERFGNYS